MTRSLIAHTVWETWIRDFMVENLFGIRRNAKGFVPLPSIGSVARCLWRVASLQYGSRLKIGFFSDRADSVISWLKLPEDIRPHLIMWYMEEPDAIGHSATPDSSATLDVVENLDKVLNHFFTEARKLDIFDKIDFIVLSDHGMATYYPERYVNLNDYLPPG